MPGNQQGDEQGGSEPVGLGGGFINRLPPDQPSQAGSASKAVVAEMAGAGGPGRLRHQPTTASSVSMATTSVRRALSARRLKSAPSRVRPVAR